MINNRDKLMERVRGYYQELYNSNVQMDEEDILERAPVKEEPILMEEVRRVVNEMKADKASDEDGINSQSP